MFLNFSSVYGRQYAPTRSVRDLGTVLDADEYNRMHNVRTLSIVRLELRRPPLDWKEVFRFPTLKTDP